MVATVTVNETRLRYVDKTLVNLQPANQPLTLSPQEFAHALGIGRDATYEAIRRKKLVVIRPGRAIRIPRSELERVLREGLE